MPTQAERSPRRSLFATHRGRTIKRLLWLLGGLAVLMMVLDGITAPDEEASDSPEAGAAAPKSVKARVAAAPANPFAPYRGINDAADSDPEAFDPDSSSTDESEDVQVDDVSKTTWQDMLTVAQNVATAYSTYDYRMKPEEYVASVPSLAPEFRKALERRAAGNWRAIQEHQVVSEASLIGTPPDLTYYRESAGRAQIAVSVAQTTSSTLPGSEEAESTRSVVLVLDRGVTDDGSPAWLVTDIIT